MTRNYKVVFFSILLVSVAAILILFWKTNGENDQIEISNTKEFDYYQFKSFDLSKYDINASIMLPDETAGIGTAFIPEMIHDEGSHLWQLKSGRNFILFIEDLGELVGVFNDFKTELTKSNAFTITMIYQSDSILVYGRSLSNKYQKDIIQTFHIFAVVQNNGRSYQFKNREEGNTKEEILFMQKSIESIQ